MTHLIATTMATEPETEKRTLRRVHMYCTDAGTFYCYSDETQATKDEWDAQCARWELENQKREQIEKERLSKQVYSDDVVNYRMGSQGGYTVDRYGNSSNGLIF
jgi:5-methylcytosine-specific restriction endonuclease McrA